MHRRKFVEGRTPNLVISLPEVSDGVNILKGSGEFDRPNSALYVVTPHNENGEFARVSYLNGIHGPTHHIKVRFSLRGGDFSESIAVEAIRKAFFEKLASARAILNFPGESGSPVPTLSEPSEIGATAAAEPEVPAAASAEAEDLRLPSAPLPQLPGTG